MHKGSFFVSGEGVYTASPSSVAGFFGHYPEQHSASVQGLWANPTGSDRIEKEYNLFTNISSIKIATAGTVGNIPVNISSNKVGGWY